MRGGSASSGSWLVTRADRVAHVGRGDVEVDAVVELDRDAAAAEGRCRRDRLDAGNARHRAFEDGGQLAVDGLGGGAGEVGVDGDDRAVDVGQLADLDAVEGGKPGDGDQRVDDEGQHRPPHEQRRDALFAFADRSLRRHLPGPAAGQEPPVATGATAGRLAAVRSARRRPRARCGCPSVTTRSSSVRSASTSTDSVLRWMMRTGVRLALPSLIGPHEGAVGAPLHGQRIDGRIGIAREFHRHLERHAGAQHVVRVLDDGPHAQGAAGLVDPVVDRAHGAFDRPPSAARSASRPAGRRP